MALEYSKAEFESSRIMQDEKYSLIYNNVKVFRDSGYPALLKHASRSSSARSSTHNLTSIESLKKEQITAEQLLDLDDDTFAQALESSYLGSRHNSTAQDQDSFNNPFETSQYQGPTIVQVYISILHEFISVTFRQHLKIHSLTWGIALMVVT